MCFGITLVIALATHTWSHSQAAKALHCNFYFLCPKYKVVAASFCGSCLPIVAFDKLLLMLTFKLSLLSLLLLLLSYFVVVNYKNFPF